MSIRLMLTIGLFAVLIAGCAAVDLNAPMPAYETGVDPSAWATIPAGEFLSGRKSDPTPLDYDYDMMVTQVTVSQYTTYLTEALSSGAVTREGEAILGFYAGDVFRGVKHEKEIAAGDWLHIQLDDPSVRLRWDGSAFVATPGYENHPMTMVTWFGAKAYCDYNGWRLPSAHEWEKAARGTDGRPYPWGHELSREHANFYASRDPFEDMRTFGSRTSPVGFYNGRTYDGYATRNNASPYGLYDMAGNVWEWVGNVYEGQHNRYMYGGSKDSYEPDLRAWVTNNATPTYYSPGVGFRCVRE
jgi:formylglycine-generating enzyme